MSEAPRPDPESRPLVKGRALQDAIGSIRDAFGEAALQRAVDTLDAEVQQLLRGNVLASEWYPVDAMCALMEASLAANDAGDESRVIARSEQVIGRQLGGVYQLFVRLGSPEWIIKRIAAVHVTYFRNVEISHSFQGERQARVRYVGFQRQHRILELVIQGFFRKALELSGARDRQVRVTTSIAAGKGHCEVELSWS